MNLRENLRNVPVLMALYLAVKNGILRIRSRLLVAGISAKRRSFTPDPDTNLIVSLTSFPARIDHAWIAIESIFQQDIAPAKVVLVLSEEEFPTRELPGTIHDLIARGLEIIWTPGNLRSYMKLLPTRARYPDAVIVTVDDDIIYERWRLRKLIEAVRHRPRSIIGHRGKVVKHTPAGLAPYASWRPAGPQTPSDGCLLTGVGGVLYPPALLPEHLLQDAGLFMELCPRADDIWLWAVALHSGVDCYCLGNNGLQPVHRLEESPALSTANVHGDGNDGQLAAVMAYFNRKVDN